MMTFTIDDFKRVAWTFVQAGVGAAVLFLAAQQAIPNSWDGLRQVAYGFFIAFVAGAFSALKNLVTPTGSEWK